MASLTTRDRIVLIVGVAVAIIVAFWLLAISPRRNEASGLDAQVTLEQSQLATARSTLASELAAKNSFARSYSELTRLGEAVPADDDVPSLLYQIQSAANDAGVNFRTIQLASTTGGAASSSSSAPATLPPGAAVGVAGFPSENFTFTFQGNFFRLSNFFARLQQLVSDEGSFLTVSGRLLTINAITLLQDAAGFPQIDADVTATAYIVPPSQGLLNGATAAGPGTTASSTSSSGSGAAAAPTTATAVPATPAPTTSTLAPAPATSSTVSPSTTTTGTPATRTPSSAAPPAVVVR